MPELLAFGFPGVPELLVVGLVVLLLFGSRLPSVMRSLGVGITEFRKGIRGEIDADGQQLVEDQIEPNSDESAIEHPADSTTPTS